MLCLSAGLLYTRLCCGFIPWSTQQSVPLPYCTGSAVLSSVPTDVPIRLPKTDHAAVGQPPSRSLQLSCAAGGCCKRAQSCGGQRAQGSAAAREGQAGSRGPSQSQGHCSRPQHSAKGALPMASCFVAFVLELQLLVGQHACRCVVGLAMLLPNLPEPATGPGALHACFP